ncbi:hypothetical protein AAEX28_13625 [Lentisphaerota bacterium WC36G]|nr:hypothetical protein LJT99_00380 [Lentisphaerae bacterium WC36]
MYNEKKIDELKSFNKNITGFGAIFFFGYIILKANEIDTSKIDEMFNKGLNTGTLGLIMLILGFFINSKIIKKKEPKN